MRFGVIIVGAGKGERLGTGVPKCLVRIENVPLMLIAAWPFERVGKIEEISLIVPTGSEDSIRIAAENLGIHRITTIVPGGERRHDSVLNGINSMPQNIDRIVIHDGARPLLSVKALERFLDVLEEERAVMIGVPVHDTLHVDNAGQAAEGPDRANLIAAQTPQGFDSTLLRNAFAAGEEREISFTDEVTLVRETMGVSARIVMGDAANIKITGSDDLRFYDLALKARARQMRGGQNAENW